MNEPQVTVCSRPIVTSGLKRASERRNAATLLVLLSAVYGLQYLDYVLLGLLVQPIKQSLHLSDTQAGLLVGVAFTLFYVVLGFPLARLADRRNRKYIVIMSVALFSLATAACGLAGGFASLFVARVCVAVGEAGTMPSAVSMLADRFKPSTRNLVMGIHSSGAYLGTAVALLVLSAITAIVTWRAIFWSVGTVGLILAALMAIFGHEPPRQDNTLPARSFLADLRVLIRNKPYVLITLGLGAVCIPSAAAIGWVPALLARSYGLAQTRIVLFLAVAWGVCATTGSLSLGYVTNKLHRRGGHGPLLVLSILSLAFPFVFLAAFTISKPIPTLVEILAAFFLMSGIRGPAFATVQDIVPGSLQATASAVLMFSMYGIGVTLGPLVTGMMSDALTAYAGSNALKYALSIVMGLGAVSAAGLLAFAARSLKFMQGADSHGGRER
jgi:predicted MFS family arabinose efflux permease